eukprot:975172-Rhodomonas_salina.2
MLVVAAHQLRTRSQNSGVGICAARFEGTSRGSTGAQVGAGGSAPCAISSALNTFDDGGASGCSRNLWDLKATKMSKDLRVINPGRQTASLQMPHQPGGYSLPSQAL